MSFEQNSLRTCLHIPHGEQADETSLYDDPNRQYHETEISYGAHPILDCRYKIRSKEDVRDHGECAELADTVTLK